MGANPPKINFSQNQGGLTGVQPPIQNSGGVETPPPNPSPCLAPLGVYTIVRIVWTPIYLLISNLVLLKSSHCTVQLSQLFAGSLVGNDTSSLNYILEFRDTF